MYDVLKELYRQLGLIHGWQQEQAEKTDSPVDCIQYYAKGKLAQLDFTETWVKRLIGKINEIEEGGKEQVTTFRSIERVPLPEDVKRDRAKDLTFFYLSNHFDHLGWIPDMEGTSEALEYIKYEYIEEGYDLFLSIHKDVIIKESYQENERKVI